MASKNNLRALGFAFLAESWFMYLLAQHGNFLAAGEAGRFVFWSVAAGLAFRAVSSSFVRADLTARQSTWIFWTGAVVLRLVVATVEPGDDLWRYRWEGMVQLHGFNPYALSPDAPVLAHLRDADWWKINHHDYPAIYPPLAEAFFAALAFCGNSVWLYKLVFSLADLACCGLLRRMLQRAGTAEAQAVWYAWNPLVVYVFTGAAHFDCLMILPLLGAILALDVYRPSRRIDGETDVSARNPSLLWLSALLLGVAAAIKVVPFALAPVWVAAAASWRKIPALFALVAAPLALSAIVYGFPHTPVFSALLRFGRDFRVNDPIWTFFDMATGSRLPGGNSLIGWTTLFVCLLLAVLFRRDWRRGLLRVWGAVLLLSPVVHAWYVVWVLPVAVWRGAAARPWLILSISMFGYFLLWEVNHESGRPWEEPLWLRLLIYLPPAAGFVWMIFTRRRNRAERTGTPFPGPTE